VSVISPSSELKGTTLREYPLVQDVGDVVTKTHRCVAFPNLYQHQVQPFHLEDPARPGHRKILVFFLVDPTQRVPSATEVAPQQREWVAEAMHNAGANSVFARLPVEILAMISEENDGTMTRLEAEDYREKLMSERTVFVDENNEGYFGMVRMSIRLVLNVQLTIPRRLSRNSICGRFSTPISPETFSQLRFTVNTETALGMENMEVSIAYTGLTNRGGVAIDARKR